MKSIFLKSLFIISIFFIHNYKSQSVNDYITFYNGITPKLNTIASNKTQFYGQNFSKFYSELSNKHITVVNLSYDSKTDTGKKYYMLALYFCNSSMDKPALDNKFQIPVVWITFENEIPSQIKNMVQEYNGVWTNTFTQFFANMKIEKIEFGGINGYNSNDWSGK
ncbi:hypothetical protein [Chryseobacterium rhizosphaerae]|uniref:hypothetical protein n=1 Tax=Chryseobacterium rhizosphaerae TaxID=395937 RepID=UPI002358BC11|nr:hypothetical protein [Chryseobacterium rhizosphaerae]MDC8098767.1 hypothetical protein [Chryseobacterium rhizosphaerae]